MKELVRISGLEITRTGCQFPESMSFEDWGKLGPSIIAVFEAWQWLVADWVNFGKRKFGEKYKLALERIPREYQTLRNWSYIATEFQLSRRRDKPLLFSHHAALCEFKGLAHKDQDKYLDIAAEMQLTVAELRHLIRTDRADALENDSSIAPCDESISDHVSKVVLWCRQNDVMEIPIQKLEVAVRDFSIVEEWVAKGKRRLLNAKAR